jgi:hypothetical protein
MFHPNQLRADPHAFIPTDQRRVSCLIAGCPCKDARIVSTRRARFFAAVARKSGETASRIVPPDPAWRIPTSTGAVPA